MFFNLDFANFFNNFLDTRKFLIKKISKTSKNPRLVTFTTCQGVILF